jgi:regulator of protease activity HflC (stomatin/prohibitin superfamily)
MSTEWIAAIVAVAAVVVAVAVVLLLTTIVVPPGTLALLLKRGKATRRALEPGRHFLPPWRKAMVEVYPSRELTLVVGGVSSPDPRVEAYDDPLRLHFGDKTFAEAKFTVRIRLDTARLREVHNRFGPEGIWPAFRDITRDAVIAEVGERALSVDDAFGQAFTALEGRLEQRLTAALADAGFALTMFTLREIDLGETGEVIQSTLRADLEVEREGALAKLRAVRLENDAAMSAAHAGVDGAVMLRYRQLEIWRDVLERWDGDRQIPAALTIAMTATPPASHELNHSSQPDPDAGRDHADASDAP